MQGNTQTNISFEQSLAGRTRGIYKEYKEFLNNTPTITKDFVVIPLIYVDKKKTDTTLTAFTYQFTDSSKPVKKVWGFCDGDKTYINVEQLNFMPLTYTAQYSIIVEDTTSRRITYNEATQTLTYKNGKKVAGTALHAASMFHSLTNAGGLSVNPGIALGTALVSALWPEGKPLPLIVKGLWFITKKGDMVEASDQSIGFILRHDKDLAEAFNKEKSSERVYLHYLMAMNKRYPL